ncbi:MAG: FAD-dependent oxidoreductase [Candidatus Gracilibacteria bacterium]|nr:FAD-dependent oxidoreductase [Candidatus Gracilibacteria bacterium]
MKHIPFTLQSKNKLTHDVYELVFTVPESIEVQPGQFVMFVLPKSGLKRAYSIAHTDGQTFTFIIKQIDGGLGSTEICSLETGENIIGMVPLGHFVLQDTPSPKLFIGTGTGFAPLYAMIRALEESQSGVKSHFIFGVREQKDSFYLEELQRIQKKYPTFSFDISLSRENIPGFAHGYVTDFLQNPEVVRQFSEFYLCGSPAMVQDTRAKLEELGILKEQVFFEQY